MRSRFAPPWMLVALLAPACGSASLEADDPVAVAHEQTRTRIMVEQAERALEVGDVGVASARLREIAESLPTHGHGQLVLARTLIAESKFREAGEVLDLVAEAFPEDPEVDLVIGTLAEARGRFEMARVAYDRALTKAPDSLTAILLQARVELVLGQPQRAAALLERKLAVMPGIRDLQEALGEAYLAAGDYLLASEWYSAALDHDPNQAALRVRLAFVQSLGGSHLEALRTAGAVAPREIPPYAQLALARSALLLDEGEQAVSWLNDYLTVFPDDAAAWVDLARAQMLVEQDRFALEALRDALRLDPGRADALTLLGHLRLRAGQRELALESYFEALRLGADATELAPIMHSLVAQGGDGENIESAPRGVAVQALGALGGTGGPGT